MKKFYDRKEEIKALQEIQLKSQNQARFTYVIGQRRVGKTALVKEAFLNQKPKAYAGKAFYFFVGRKTPDVLLAEFAKVLRQEMDFVGDFGSFADFFSYLFVLTKKEPVTIILDEFQNFTYVDESVFSTLQRLWDEHQYPSRINLVCVGSLFSSMEKIFASKHEPLYGRSTNRFNLMPFKVTTLKQILTDNNAYSLERLVNLYTLFNGVPKYYELLEREKLFTAPVSAVFKKLFLDEGAPLKEEGKDILLEEFGTDYQTYFSILESIATLQNPTNQKIASAVGLAENSLGTYLSRLEKNFSLIKRTLPILNPSNRLGVYRLNDRFLTTWFRYLDKHRSFLESGNQKYILDDFKQDFFGFRGWAFEDFTRELLMSNYDKYSYTDWGKYWTRDLEVDIVGLNKKDKKLLVGECVFSAKSVNKALADELDKKAQILSGLCVGYKVEKHVFTAGDFKDITGCGGGIKIVGGSSLDKLI